MGSRAKRSPAESGRFPLSSDNQLARQLGWLIGIRLVVVTSVTLPHLFFRLSAAANQPVFDLLLKGAGITYLASLLYAAMLAIRRPPLRSQAYIQFFGDLCLITGLVYFFGGASSPFSILFLLVIAVASVFSSRKVGIGVATVGWVLYAGTILGLQFEAIPHPFGAEPPTVSARHLTYNLAMHFFGFYAMALLTSHLSQIVARTELALRQKRELLADLQVAHRDVLESIPSGLITTDPTGLITSANIAAYEILDQSEWMLVGTRITEIGLFGEDDWRDLRDSTSIAVRDRYELDYPVGDRVLHIGYALNPLARADGSVAGYLLIFQDLSEWRKLQEQVQLKDRMAAVGTMASGLAHEIGNPMAAISGSVQMLASSFQADSAQRKLLDILLKESQRLDRTIRDFLQFARPKAGASSRFDIGELLTENVELLRNSSEVSEHHTVELELKHPATTLLADRDQVSQVFWNVARNGLRAMESGGTLRIAGGLVGTQYEMAFTDNGRGMTDREKAGLFHPFRTFFDEGSGIGMAIVYRIVEEHQGELKVESHPGRGTSIVIQLPNAEPVPTPLPVEA
jgi:two-component system sensor histidine kinase PilS (NtrC family)